MKIEPKYYEKNIREALLIKTVKCSDTNVINCDDGTIAVANTWMQLFAKILENKNNSKTSRKILQIFFCKLSQLMGQYITFLNKK